MSEKPLIGGNPPTVSVVVPTYNSAKTIGKTIQSVLEQTYTHYEIIVVDDGSQDETISLIQKFKDERIKLYPLPRVGHMLNRNRALRLAGGEFLALLDSDDIWSAEKLHDHVTALLENPEAVAAYCWVDHIGANDEYLHPGTRTICNGDAYPSLLQGNWLHTGSNIVARHQAIEASGGFDESLTHCADWDLYLKLAKLGGFICIPKVQVYYRRQPGSLSGRLQGVENSFIKLLDREYEGASEVLIEGKVSSISSQYEYLLGQATLQQIPNHKAAIWTLRMIGRAQQNDPTFVSRILKKAWLRRALIKVLVGLIFPERFNNFLINTVRGRKQPSSP